MYHIEVLFLVVDNCFNCQFCSVSAEFRHSSSSSFWHLSSSLVFMMMI